jgi:hypothetical protein
VNGDFQMTNSGSSTTLIVPAGVTLTVTGNMGDCTNNNVNFQIDGTLIVLGTLYGKNTNTFSGGGSITAGGIDMGNNATCPAPCNINWDVGTCTAGGTFCSLPIRLSMFDAEVKANGVHVRWVTESDWMSISLHWRNLQMLRNFTPWPISRVKATRLTAETTVSWMSTRSSAVRIIV